MACFLMASSHYLMNKCWLLIKTVMCGIHFTFSWNNKVITCKFRDYSFRITTTYPKGHGVGYKNTHGVSEATHPIRCPAHHLVVHCWTRQPHASGGTLCRHQSSWKTLKLLPFSVYMYIYVPIFELLSKRASSIHPLFTNGLRDHFVYAPSQWKTTLQCNISHWLGAYTKWSPHGLLKMSIDKTALASSWPKLLRQHISDNFMKIYLNFLAWIRYQEVIFTW